MLSNERSYSIPSTGHVSLLGVFMFEWDTLNPQESPKSHHTQTRG